MTVFAELRKRVENMTDDDLILAIKEIMDDKYPDMDASTRKILMMCFFTTIVGKKRTQQLMGKI
ncbi:MAG: hypothetical protein HQK77_12840 [Desulfobacterales bacterium]|nr:hypothetical protein [Desulfobacterales bacterium]